MHTGTWKQVFFTHRLVINVHPHTNLPIFQFTQNTSYESIWGGGLQGITNHTSGGGKLYYNLMSMTSQNMSASKFKIIYCNMCRCHLYWDFPANTHHGHEFNQDPCM